MNLMDNSQTNARLEQEIGALRQRIAELEAGDGSGPANTYADFLFKNSGETILIIDPYSMRILDANPNAARRLGYRQAELRQLALDQIEMPRALDADEAETTWQSAVSGTFYYETRYRHKDGELMPMEVSSRLASWQGRDVLINFVRDIRWRKEAEMALRLVNSTLEQEMQARAVELAAEKEKLETVLDTTTEGISMTDAVQNVLYVNPAFVSITGYSLEETKGQKFENLFEFSAIDLKAQAAAWEIGQAWRGEVNGVSRDGRIYPTLLAIVPMFGQDGRIAGFVTSHQDISYFKALDLAHSSFITNVSHQLRTPLTSIKLYTQLLNGNLNPGKTAEYLKILSAEAERLEHLVEDILELARLESDQSTLEWQPVDLNEMLLQLTESNQARALKQRQRLRCSIEGSIPAFHGNPAKLRQAFAELVDNALIYTPEGGTVSLEIRALVENERQWIIVKVQDDGPGIPTEEQDRIFDRFYRGQLAETGQAIGTGLGLCITRQIAEAHKGHITLQSEPGAGSAFSVWLPVNLGGLSARSATSAG